MTSEYFTQPHGHDAEAATIEQTKLQELISAIPHKALDFLTKNLSNETLIERINGIDGEDDYSFSGYVMVGNPETGYCVEISQNYNKKATEITNLLAVRALYGMDPKLESSGDILELSSLFDISGDTFELVDVSERYVATNRKRVVSHHTDEKVQEAILGRLNTILAGAEIVPEEITGGVKSIRGEYGKDYDYRKIIKSIEKKQTRKTNILARLGEFIRKQLIQSEDEITNSK
jgi:hypothetical protein